MVCTGRGIVCWWSCYMVAVSPGCRRTWHGWWWDAEGSCATGLLGVVVARVLRGQDSGKDPAACERGHSVVRGLCSIFLATVSWAAEHHIFCSILFHRPPQLRPLVACILGGLTQTSLPKPDSPLFVDEDSRSSRRRERVC